MSGCPHDIAAIRVSTGNSGELDLITPSYGFIRYNTTEHNLEVYEENGWKDIVINDKTNIDISGKIVVNDVSINSNLLAVDASFSNIGGIDDSLIVLGDLSVTGNIYTSDGLVGTGGGGGGGGGGGVLGLISTTSSSSRAVKEDSILAPAKSIFLYSTRHRIKAVTRTKPERT